MNKLKTTELCTLKRVSLMVGRLYLSVLKMHLLVHFRVKLRGRVKSCLGQGLHWTIRMFVKRSWVPKSLSVSAIPSLSCGRVEGWGSGVSE